ncbi:MAG: GHMP kinase [Patescibacteria group bacterium]
MIIVRAPLRISFVGGGTDLPDFYHKYPGRVISTTINKFIYLSINPTGLLNKFIMKYNTTEIVADPSELKHDRARGILLDLGIKHGLEITSSADIPAKTGLGSSSGFSVALVKGLNYLLGKSMSRIEAAEAACRLEIELLKEPIGKQDQYAASFGGFNIFQFNSDETVTIEPILLDYKKRAKFEDHLILFFTGITRSAASVLGEQKTKIESNFETYKKMSDSVYDFRDKLMAGDLEGMAAMLHEGWLRKRSLASAVSNSLIDVMYETGIKNGAWGGKILGAGGGGCLLFLAPLDKHEQIKASLKKLAAENNLSEAQAIPFNFTQSGTDILFSDNVS